MDKIITAEELAESILVEASRKENGAFGCKNDGWQFDRQTLEEAQKLLIGFGTTVQYNDTYGGFRFTINSVGMEAVALGGINAYKHSRQLREREVVAAEKSAESSRKAKNYALWADIIAVIAIVVSIIALIKGW